MMETAVGSSRMVFQSGSRTTSNSRGGRGSWGMAAKVAPPSSAGKEVDSVRHNSATVETLPYGARRAIVQYVHLRSSLNPSHHRTMTIAIALKVGDGVVLGADSASALVTMNGYAENVYFSGEKVLNLVPGLPVGLLTYGLGGLENRST